VIEENQDPRGRQGDERSPEQRAEVATLAGLLDDDLHRLDRLLDGRVEVLFLERIHVLWNEDERERPVDADNPSHGGRLLGHRMLPWPVEKFLDPSAGPVDAVLGRDSQHRCPEGRDVPVEDGEIRACALGLRRRRVAAPPRGRGHCQNEQGEHEG
jgi:hypothetical protein